ncbi:MAG: hypothetical protein AAFR71_05590 [Pseudomonadota bacterium]
MKLHSMKSIIGLREIRAMARVLAVSALFAAPFIFNQQAHANYGATNSTGVGFVLYMSLMHAR